MRVYRLKPEAAANKLREWGDSLEHGNYHAEAAGYRKLADELVEQLELDGLEQAHIMLPGHEELEGDSVHLHIDTQAPDLRGVKLYVHNDKDSNWHVWENNLGQPENEAGRRFSYAALELELLCTVDIDTGRVMCQAVNGVRLEQEIELS